MEGLLACFDVLGDSQFVNKAASVWKAQKYNSENNSFGICCSDVWVSINWQEPFGIS